jgi:hypothetical protein
MRFRATASEDVTVDTSVCVCVCVIVNSKVYSPAVSESSKSDQHSKTRLQSRDSIFLLSTVNILVNSN